MAKENNKSSAETAASSAEVILQNLKITSDILRAAENSAEALEYTIRILLKFGFDRVRLYLAEENSTKLRGAKCSYLADEVFRRVTIDLKNKDEPGSRLLEKKPLYDTTNPTLARQLHDATVQETILIPLSAGRRLIGSISVDNALTGRPLNFKDNLTALTPFANHIALVINRVLSDEKLRRLNKQLEEKVAVTTSELVEKNERLKHLANHDELTGLPNRRMFNKELEQALHRATKRRPLTLAMMDIDYFKQANDTHGHIYGDQIIATIGQILHNKKEITFAARYAGDEFVLLLEGLGYPADKALLDRICQRIRREAKVTVSIGAALYPSAKIQSSLDLIRVADDALYHAKHSGRNRAVAAHEPGVTVTSFAERKQALQELEEENADVVSYIEQLQIINDINAAVKKYSTDRDIASAVLKVLQKQIGFERIRLYSVSGDSYDCLWAVGLPHTLWKNLARSHDAQTLVPTIARTKQILDIADTKRLHKISPVARSLGSKAAVGVPLMSGNGKLSGVLIADYDPARLQLSSADHSFMLNIGTHVALALEQSWLLEKTRLANTQLEEKIALATAEIKQYAESLEKEIAKNHQLTEAQEHSFFDMITSLVAMIETKDPKTKSHSGRVTSYAVQLGRAAGLDAAALDDVKYGAMLHDIGKLGVDERILNKTTPLTDAEVAQLAKHPEYGHDIIKNIRFLGSRAKEIVLLHHERWDGRGYPHRLQAEKIPALARLVHVVDAFDAMITSRSYGTAESTENALKEITRHAGTQFDPRFARLFVKLVKTGKIRVLHETTTKPGREYPDLWG